MALALTFLIGYVGIDVACESLEVVIRIERKAHRKSFFNTPAGFADLQAWMLSFGAQQYQVVLEHTGSYSDAISRWLWQQGHVVSLLNPAQAASYRAYKQQRNKTDQIDAALLAQQAEEEKPRPWNPWPQEYTILRQLVKERWHLVQMRVKRSNHLHAGRQNTYLRTQIEERCEVIDGWVAQADLDIALHIQRSPLLKHPYELLLTIPGVGWVGAATLLAEIGEISRYPKPGSLVNLAGLSIVQKQSGKCLQTRGHIDRHGRRGLRTILYLCAQQSLRYDPAMQAWASRFLERKLPPKVVRGIVMRKLLHVIYGVLSHEVAYDPSKLQVTGPQAA